MDGVYSEFRDIKGRFSSVNFAASNSLITAKFKSLTGTLSDNLTTSQKQEIDRKLINDQTEPKPKK